MTIRLKSSLATFGARALRAALCLSLSSLPALAETNCEKELEVKFGNVVQVNETEAKSPEVITLDYVLNNCEENRKAEVNLSQGHTDKGVRWGACELSHFAIRDHFTALKSRYLDFCSQAEAMESKKDGCNSSKDKSDVQSCIRKLNADLTAAQKKFEDVKKAITGTPRKTLADRKKKNEFVLDKFQRDQRKIEVGETEHFEANQGFSDVNEYKSLLTPPPAEQITAVQAQKKNIEKKDGELIDEQQLAEKNLDRYLNAMEKLEKEGSVTIDKTKMLVTNLDSRLSNMKSTGMGDYVGPAAGAAPALASALKNTPASTASSASSISGAGAVVPLAGLALAGSAASRSGSSSSVAQPSLPAATTAPLATTSFGGAAAIPNAEKNSLKNTADSPAEKKADPTAATTVFSGGILGSDGSSRAGSLKRSPASAGAVNSASPATAENFANPGAEFSGMPMQSRSPTKTTSAAGEVTNLLGQMKSLFDFGDGSGGGPGGGGPEAAFGGAAPSMGGAVAPSTEYADTGNTSGNPDYSADVPQEEGAVQSAGLSILPDSLFVRVHKRHRHYQEMGLLVVNLGGIR